MCHPAWARALTEAYIAEEPVLEPAKVDDPGTDDASPARTGFDPREVSSSR